MEEVLRFYYASPRDPIGMQGDFYTSADLDPIFGYLLAKQFSEWAADFDAFRLVELGAGKGLLARDILQHCQLPYLILERSPAMRARQEQLLKKHDVEWVDELPIGLTGCIFSNEFFDALPVHRVVRRAGVLKEIYVVESRVDAPLIRATAPFTVAVVLIALGVVVLGCAPNLLIGKLSAAIQSAGFQ